MFPLNGLKVVCLFDYSQQRSTIQRFGLTSIKVNRTQLTLTFSVDYRHYPYRLVGCSERVTVHNRRYPTTFSADISFGTIRPCVSVFACMTMLVYAKVKTNEMKTIQYRIVSRNANTHTHTLTLLKFILTALLTNKISSKIETEADLQLNESGKNVLF